jgi:hypothetical protein
MLNWGIRTYIYIIGGLNILMQRSAARRWDRIRVDSALPPSLRFGPRLTSSSGSSLTIATSSTTSASRVPFKILYPMAVPLGNEPVVLDIYGILPRIKIQPALSTARALRGFRCGMWHATHIPVLYRIGMLD